jgi:hypothetical protein
LPIYKNGLPAGGVGVEGDGLYTVDRNPADDDQTFEELIAASGIRGFEAPALIRGDNILVDGIRLPFSNVPNPPTPAPQQVLPARRLDLDQEEWRLRQSLFPQTVGGIAVK